MCWEVKSPPCDDVSHVNCQAMHLMRKKVAAALILAACKKHLKARAEKKLREEVRHCM